MTGPTLLVPLDGSQLAERALPVADSLLQSRGGGRMLIFRALETPKMSAWLPAEMLDIYEQEREIVDEYLEKQLQEWSGRGYEVEVLRSQGPGPLPEVVKECENRAVHLIVMSSHGQSGWVESFLGSNTEKILRLSNVPVLVVRTEHESRAGGNRILIPLDGSKRAENALTQAIELAPGGSARITLIGVSVVFQGHAFEGDMRTTVEPDLKKINEYLEKHSEWLANQGYNVDIVVRRGNPAEEILQFSEENDTDLILMTTQGRTGLASWLYGSVAERVLRKSKCSVLVLKDQQQKG